jgi:hypothetical protein
MKKAYESELGTFTRELESLVRQRAEIDRKIHRVKQIIQGIAALSGVDVDENLAALTEYENRGLASGIQSILQVLQGPMSAASIRQSLIASGHDLSGYANASSVINTILNRLVGKGLVIKELTEKEGQSTTTYKWVGMHPRTRPKKPSVASDVPNPFGRTIVDMLKDNKKK